VVPAFSIFMLVFRRKIEPHIPADKRGSSRLTNGCACGGEASPATGPKGVGRKIEELFGEGKEYHGLRRFRRRRQYRVREETSLIEWVLKLKRLAKLLTAKPALA